MALSLSDSILIGVRGGALTKVEGSVGCSTEAVDCIEELCRLCCLKLSKSTFSPDDVLILTAALFFGGIAKAGAGEIPDAGGGEVAEGGENTGAFTDGVKAGLGEEVADILGVVGIVGGDGPEPLLDGKGT